MVNPPAIVGELNPPDTISKSDIKMVMCMSTTTILDLCSKSATTVYRMISHPKECFSAVSYTEQYVIEERQHIQIIRCSGHISDSVTALTVGNTWHLSS
jgi:hypothetical protein